MQKFKSIKLKKTNMYTSSAQFVYTFVYAKERPYHISGIKQDVIYYIHDNFPLCHYLLVLPSKDRKRKLIRWCMSRSTWSLRKENGIYKVRDDNRDVIVTFKNPPKKYIKEFDLLDKANILMELANDQ